MHLLQTFSTPIWIEDLELDLPNIINTIKTIQLNDHGRTISNMGGWQSNDLDLKMFNEHKHLVDMSNKINKAVMDICTQVDTSLQLFISNIWFNINKPHDYNIAHYHPNSAFSGIVYIQCEPNSSIYFEHDTLKNHYPFKTNSDLFADKLQIYPSNGRLIVFPSWIKHSVPSNQSDSERISIAFNMQQKGI